MVKSEIHIPNEKLPKMGLKVEQSPKDIHQGTGDSDEEWPSLEDSATNFSHEPFSTRRLRASVLMLALVLMYLGSHRHPQVREVKVWTYGGRHQDGTCRS